MASSSSSAFASKDPRKAFPSPQEVSAHKAASQRPPGGSEAKLPQQGMAAPDFGLDSYRGSGRLQGLSAIITGSDSGIGRAVALAFAREGCAKLVLTSLDTGEEKEDLARTVSVIEEQGGPGPGGERGTTKVVAVSGDLTDEAFRVAVVEAAGSTIGELEAGGGGGGGVFFFLSSFRVFAVAAKKTPHPPPPKKKLDLDLAPPTKKNRIKSQTSSSATPPTRARPSPLSRTCPSSASNAPWR